MGATANQSKKGTWKHGICSKFGDFK